MQPLHMSFLCTGSLIAVVLLFAAMGDPASAAEPEGLGAADRETLLPLCTGYVEIT